MSFVEVLPVEPVIPTTRQPPARSDWSQRDARPPSAASGSSAAKIRASRRAAPHAA